MTYASDATQIKICVILVGLPACGKSFTAQKLVRYLNWMSIKANVFNVGQYRRKVTAHPNADFFKRDNEEGQRLRREAAEAAMNDLLTWIFEEDGQVAVYDATNSTKNRRAWIVETLSAWHVHPLFVETVCEDKELIFSNIMDVKTNSPDYAGQDPVKAAKDFMARIETYRDSYQTISNAEHLSYVKLKNVGTQVIINHIQSYFESHIVYYLMNLHVKPRKLWLSRHGESQYNLTGQLGGDSDLSTRGMTYAHKLPDLLAKALADDGIPESQLTVWTSTLRRTQQTAQDLPYPKLQWKALDELDAGVCDGLTYKEIQEKYPADFAARDENKFEYRYRGGESYRDVVARLDPIIMELERQENIMIVTHQAVLRCIYAYYMNVPQEKSPWMDIPLHTLICLEPRAYGTKETRISAHIPAVSTFRARGEQPKE